MLSKAQIKHITALRSKKSRYEHAQFIVEGKKCVEELLNAEYEVENVYYTQQQQAFFDQNSHAQATLINEQAMSKISGQKNPEGILAVAHMPNKSNFEWEAAQYIALDSIRDPGNLGTIIRLADWFGANIICSPDCVDHYNPKVIQASMGSLFHTPIHYLDLTQALPNTKLTKWAATLDGENIYAAKKSTEGILLIGNEANGLSKAVQDLATQKITIPNKGKAESLNAAMACGILASHIFE